MKRSFKILKRIAVTLLVILGVFLVIGILFINLSPEFGGEVTKEQRETYAKSEYHQNGRFAP